ncbi:hypothetical protein BHE74_00043672 [Ensete ventricosum]|nr:hypothetical protein BHE74_00043672 [Ensete ventricosum]
MASPTHGGPPVRVGTASTMVPLPVAYPFGHCACRCCLCGCCPCKRPARGQPSLQVVCRRWLDPVGGLVVGVHPRLVTLTTSDRPNMVLGHKRLPL